MPRGAWAKPLCMCVSHPYTLLFFCLAPEDLHRTSSSSAMGSPFLTWPPDSTEPPPFPPGNLSRKGQACQPPLKSVSSIVVLLG